MRAAIYARVSSAKQRDSQTIASQLSTLPAWCRSRGWEVVGTYVDDGKSAKAGRLEERDGLRRLLDDAKDRRFGLVAVLDVDRLTRSEDPIERALILGSLQIAGVKIAEYTTGIVHEGGTFAGDVLLSIRSLFAVDDNRKRAERIRLGKIESIRRGGKPAGPTPYGYRYDRATKTWSIDEPAAEIIREVLSRVAAGETCQAIGADLQARGVPRPRSGVWSLERVWALTRRRYYVDGEWIADKAQDLRVRIPTIASEALWRRADARLAETGKRGLQRSRTSALLQGLLTCGQCGSRVGIHYSGRPSVGEKKVARYYCTRRRRGLRDPHRGESCDLPLPRIEDVDAAVWSEIEALITRPRLLERALALPDSSDAGQLERDLAEATARLERHDRAGARILQDYSRGAIPEITYQIHAESAARRRRLLAQQVATLSARLDGHRASVAQRQEARATLQALRGRVREADPAQRRAVVLALFGDGGAVLRADGSVEGAIRIGAAPPDRDACSSRPVHSALGALAIPLLAAPRQRR